GNFTKILGEASLEILWTGVLTSVGWGGDDVASADQLFQGGRFRSIPLLIGVKNK
ncbi:hypothetical protein J6590_106675, partial [Homalodisca vitripennis]